MFKSTSNFEKLLEKATSNLLLEPDWNSVLQICDLIRQGDYQPKPAVAAIKKKLYQPNPHVVFYALQVLESCVKNCGSLIHDEVATKQFMEELKDMVKTTPHENVKNKILELIQTWAHAFRRSPKYRAVQDTLNIMKTEGYKFPALQESDAMFVADAAPEWADGDCCHRCRVQFNMMQRKHHCRACGQVFCSKCSSRTSTLPKYGIEKEVRVCEACYEQVGNLMSNRAGTELVDEIESTNSSSQKAETDLPSEYLGSSLSQQSQAPPKKTQEELQEEEELNLALALSKSEAEEKEKEKLRATTAILSSSNKPRTYSPTPDIAPSLAKEDEMDPELARYLNRGYWEQKHKDDENKHSSSSPSSVQPSAPVGVQNNVPSSPSFRVIEKYQNGETDEVEEFVSTLRSQLEIFVNRMKSNSTRGRCIANDTSVQTLFMNITALHSQLFKYIQMQDEKRAYYESLQDKLTQAKDARAALDALREEHRERLRRQAEEAERQRHIQMAQKLEIMRKKKQEYLQYQRQLALQRMQEQEREMQMRQEQQKQQYMRGQMPPYNPFIPPPGAPQGFPPPTAVNGSPLHAPFHGPVLPMHAGTVGFPPPPPPMPSSQPISAPQTQGFPEFHPPYGMPGMPSGSTPSGVNQGRGGPFPSTQPPQNQPQSPPGTSHTSLSQVPEPQQNSLPPAAVMSPPAPPQPPASRPEEQKMAELISFD